jgi:LacI family transcriptional regulator
MALGCCRALRDLNLVMGSDVSLIAHDDGLSYIRPEALSPPLTTTTSSLREAGVRIAELAHRIATGTPVSSIAEVWPVDLIFRGSANPPRS